MADGRWPGRIRRLNAGVAARAKSLHGRVLPICRRPKATRCPFPPDGKRMAVRDPKQTSLEPLSGRRFPMAKQPFVDQRRLRPSSVLCTAPGQTEQANGDHVLVRFGSRPSLASKPCLEHTDIDRCRSTVGETEQSSSSAASRPARASFQSIQSFRASLPRSDIGLLLNYDRNAIL